MDIEQIYSKFKERVNNQQNKWNKEARMLHLVEEVGELAEIILQVKGFKSPSKSIDDIRIALADVLEDIMALCELYEIEFSEVIEEVLRVDEK